jgi:PPOX class probable F420-dependent enzyme
VGLNQSKRSASPRSIDDDRTLSTGDRRGHRSGVDHDRSVVQTPLTREDDPVTLLTQLSDEGRQHFEARLRSNLMIWLTTVSPSGRPDSVPVWFLLCDDETLLVYSQPGKPKLRNIRVNPNVALRLDVTDIGRDVIRLAGLAQHDTTIPPAQCVALYCPEH